MTKNLLLLCLLSLAFSGTCFAQPTSAPTTEEDKEEEEWEDPSCVFSGMMWDGSSIEDLGYFIDGDEKGDFIPVFLPNGGRSRKYAYYGDSPIIFYREIEVEDEKDDANPGKPPPVKKDEDSEKEKEKKIEHIPITAAQFKESWKEAFFFFAKVEDNQKNVTWQVKPLDFSQDSFPAGKFWFISQCREEIFLAFGADKERPLNFGQDVKLDAKLDKFGDLTILVFKKTRGLKRKVYSTIWNFNPRARTLVFLQHRPNGVSVRRISDLVLEEQAQGLRPAKDGKKKDTSPLRGPGN